MNLRQSDGYGRRTLRRLIKTAPVVLLFVLAACGGGEPTAAPAAQSPAAQPAVQAPASAAGVAVETGGMALPALAPTEPPVLQVGAALTAAGAVVLYAEPDRTAPRFAEYVPGSRFTVVEPDSDHAVYPVAVDGQHWYRVRAEDGLVGWMAEE